MRRTLIDATATLAVVFLAFAVGLVHATRVLKRHWQREDLDKTRAKR